MKPDHLHCLSAWLTERRSLLSQRMLLTWLLVLHFFSCLGKNFLVNLGEEIDQFQSNNATEYSSHGNDYSNQGSDIMCKYWRFCLRWYTCRWVQVKGTRRTKCIRRYTWTVLQVVRKMSELAAGSERIRNRAGTRIQWNRGGQKGKGLEFGQKSDVEFVCSIRSKARVKRFSSGKFSIPEHYEYWILR